MTNHYFVTVREDSAGVEIGTTHSATVIGHPPTVEDMRTPNYLTSQGLQLSCTVPSTHYDIAVLGLLKLRELFPERVLEYVVDLGAHAGAVGLLAAHWGALRCLLVEPAFVPRLWHNVYANHFEDRCTILPCAVWTHDGAILDMMTALDPAIISNVDSGYGAPFCTTPALTMSFNTIINMLPRVDFLKIDVEGAEFMFLNDDIRLLLKKISAIDLELHVPPDDEVVTGLQGLTFFDMSSGLQGKTPTQRAREIIQMFLAEGFQLYAGADEAAYFACVDPTMHGHLLFYKT